MKKLILLFLIAVFLIVVGLLMYDNKKVLHISPERNQNLREGILIGKLKVHGFYKRIVTMWIFEPDSNKKDDINWKNPSMIYVGPAMSDKEAKRLSDTLQYIMEHPEKVMRKIEREYDDIYNTWSAEPKSNDTIKWRLFHR